MSYQVTGCGEAIRAENFRVTRPKWLQRIESIYHAESEYLNSIIWKEHKYLQSYAVACASWISQKSVRLAKYSAVILFSHVVQWKSVVTCAFILLSNHYPCPRNPSFDLVVHLLNARFAMYDREQM